MAGFFPQNSNDHLTCLFAGPNLEETHLTVFEESFVLIENGEIPNGNFESIICFDSELLPVEELNTTSHPANETSHFVTLLDQPQTFLLPVNVTYFDFQTLFKKILLDLMDFFLRGKGVEIDRGIVMGIVRM